MRFTRLRNDMRDRGFKVLAVFVLSVGINLPQAQAQELEQENLDLSLSELAEKFQQKSLKPAQAEEPALDPAKGEGTQLAQAQRRRPGSSDESRRERKEDPGTRIPAATNPEQAQRQQEFYELQPQVPPSNTEFFPVANRWDMFYAGKWYDPYNQNILKGDIPLFGQPGHEWFLELTGLSDSLFEHSNVPTPVGLQSTTGPNSTDVFGSADRTLWVQNLLFEVALIRGNTTFKPQDLEFRLAPIINITKVDADETGVVRADPARGTHRDDANITFLEAFIDYHLMDLTDRYDFISTRVGIQKFNADFRGFLYNDEQPGIRLFGNYDNNRLQGNLAYFYRLEKDANALQTRLFERRHEHVLVGNVYRQDALVLGHTIQGTVLYRADLAGSEGVNFDENGNLTRPTPIGDERSKNIHNTYLGLNTDGHIDRMNIISSLYYATGSESHNPIAGQRVDISAWMAALELSVDIDWVRPRASIFWASGDDDPFDGDAEGFDAVQDVPNFAGSDTSYWQRQGIPYIAGGNVNLVNRLSLLPNLRAGKEQGQSNFVNPGIFIYTLGLDVDVTPKLKLLNNLSYLHFDDTSSLEATRQDGSIDEEIGVDISSSFLYRPFLNNNVQVRMGAAVLLPGDGTESLFGSDTLYQGFTNLIFLY